MSRSDVLVDADWAEAHINDPGVVIVEVDEDTSAYDKAISRPRFSSTGRRTCKIRSAATSSTRRASRRCYPSAASPTTTRCCSTAATTTGSPPRLLVLQALRARPRCLLLDGGRKKWELDSRELSTRWPERPRTSYTASEQDASLRALRDEVLAAIGQRNLVDVRSPDEFTGRLLAAGPPAPGAGAARRPHPDRA